MRRLRHPVPLAALVVATLFLGVAPAIAKRAAPRPVTPVVIGSVRYEAPPWSKAAGHGQNGGVVEAHDAITGAQLWSTLVYTTVQDRRREADVQDVFIVELQPSADGRALLVVDERHRRWRVDLASHAASPEPVR